MKHLEMPKAVLFDFGGGLVSVTKRDAGYGELAGELHTFIEYASGTDLDPSYIEESLREAAQRYGEWKDQCYLEDYPMEITHRQFWEEYVAGQWPVEARSAVVAHATVLCERYEQLTMEREKLPGIVELLDLLDRSKVRTGCISNALAGVWSRKVARSLELESHLGVQIYSDEIGMRKPNPRLFELALDCLGADRRLSWYIGDKLDRDILASRRSGLGMAILLPSAETYKLPKVDVEPDLVIESLHELRKMLGDKN